MKLVLYLVLSLIELVEECSLNYAVAVYYGFTVSAQSSIASHLYRY
jgi:hypothetical protein